MVKNKFAFGLIFLFLIREGTAQNNFTSLSRKEKKWALLHPFVALRVKNKMKTALSVVAIVQKENLLDQYENGGKLDAFRHIFTMAFLSQTIPIKKLRSLGKMHEQSNKDNFLKGKLENGELADSVSCEMDLLNNEIGFELGKKFHIITLDSLKMIVISEIKSGKAWEIARNEKGNYINCEKKEIQLGEWENNWQIPKCLKKTN